MAEGRGKAQADTLRKSRTQTHGEAPRSTPDDRDQVRARSAPQTLRRGDLVLCMPGDIIPGDGEVIEGVASVDESAITGETAPVIRESGGDRSAVTGGTKVLSDYHRHPHHGESRRDVPRPHDRARRGRVAAEDAERDRAHDPALGPDDHLPVRRRHAAAVRDLQRRAGGDPGADRAARVPHPDDDRRPALGDRHRRHGSHDPAERDRHERPRGRSGRRRQHAAARQDRHDHARQPPGGGVRSRSPGVPPSVSPIARSWRRCRTRRRKAGASSCSRRTKFGLRGRDGRRRA